MTAGLVELEVGVSKACKSVMIRLSDGEKVMQNAHSITPATFKI